MKHMMTGKVRKRPGAVHAELEDALIASYQRKVACKVCGYHDNDWPDRHGLCHDCYCLWLNTKIIGLKMSMADAVKEADELDDPDVILQLRAARWKKIEQQKEAT